MTQGLKGRDSRTQGRAHWKIGEWVRERAFVCVGRDSRTQGRAHWKIGEWVRERAFVCVRERE